MGVPLNIDWRQILLHLFNFIILTGGLYFLLYSPIKKFIHKREEHYRLMDSEANERLESARSLEEQAKQRFDSVDREIKEHRIKAETELDRYTNQQIEDAKAEAEKIINDAKKDAVEQKRSILDSAQREIIQMAKETTAKILHSSTDEAYSQFLDTAERDVCDE